MAFARTGCIAAVLLGVSAGLAAEAPAPVSVLWLQGVATKDRSPERLAGVAAALRQTVKAPVQADLPERSSAWLDDPRGLPGRLLGLPATSHAQFVLCFRVVGAEAAKAVCEAAWVDRPGAALLAFRAFDLPADQPLTPLSEGLARFASESLPRQLLSATPPPSLPAPSHLLPAGGSRDAVRQPSTAGIRAPLLPTTTADGGLLAQLGQGFLGAGGLGPALTPPKVLTGSCDLRLRLPAVTETAVSMSLSVYAVAERNSVEVRFSQPVHVQPPTRDGTRVTLAIDQLQPDLPTELSVERGGLRRLVVGPLATGGTALTFELTPAGEVELTGGADGRWLRFDVFKSAERARELTPVAGPVPYAGQFRVVKIVRGTGTWYGNHDDGGMTASGERYNQWGWTAAHRTLPFGTWVRVTNLNNGRQVYVRINDRGPTSRQKIIDVSAAAAQALGFYHAGVAPVEVEVLQPE